MIKGTVFAIFIVSIIGISCTKSTSGGGCNYTASTVAVPDSEVLALKDSIYNHFITNATVDPTGFYYHIDSAGSGTSVSGLCSKVSVSYAASFFNGTIFDSTATNIVASFQLGAAIVGWQKALPLLNSGGVMTLYLPPSLAYGPNPVLDNFGNVTIPGNSYLVFKIHLVGVQ